MVANNTPPSSAYTPAQIQAGYGFGSSFNGVPGDGRGETIAIVDAYDDPNIQADLTAFDAQFGLPNPMFARVNQSGGTTSYPPADSSGGWELEESLDVEWAHAMAPGANIILVEANSSGSNDLLAAVSYAAANANVVSMSWGGSEYSTESSDDSYFNQSGVAFVASSGDGGAPPIWPAVSPDVLAVGGTTLSLSASGAWLGETGWSGSGGGPSAYESQPPYQNGTVKQTSTARANPDVAYDADPNTGVAVYDSIPYEGTSYGWIQVGGTSAGAPQWSALLAIADQGRAAYGQQPLNNTNPQQVMDILYENPADFHDITTGMSTGSPHYSAGPGYDYVTGLGSPMASLVIGSFTSTTPASNDALVLTAPTTDTVGTPLSLTVTAQKPSGGTDTGYLGTIRFSSTDAAAGLPGNYTFTAADKGTHTFTLTFGTAGNQSITATDTANFVTTGTISGIAVSPAAPTNLVAGAVSANQINLTWSGAAGATGYMMQLSFSGTAGWTTLGTTSGGNATSYQETGLSAATTYYFRVLATAGNLDSAYSNVASATTSSSAVANDTLVPAAPTTETAGTSWSLTVSAEKPSGATDTAYRGTIHFTSSDAAAGLPGNYTFTAADMGVHTFTLAFTFETAGSQSITATDTANSPITGTLSGITVSPAAPTKLLAAAVSANQINLTWTSAAGATGYLIQDSSNGSIGWTQVGTISGGNTTSYQQPGLSAATTYYFRVLATAGNLDSAYSSVASATTTGTAVTVDTLWSNSYVPMENNYSGGSYELGVKFTAGVTGAVTGVRFYEQSFMRGYTHVGHLWSSTGTLLATATFPSQSGSGWQQASFSSPVSIQANTVYVVSFSTGGGLYGSTSKFFSSSGFTNGPLQALSNSTSGGDGVYNTRAGSFPNVSGNGSNYWVDLAFTPSGTTTKAKTLGTSPSVAVLSFSASGSTAGQSNFFVAPAPAAVPTGPARVVSGPKGTTVASLGTTSFRRTVAQVRTPTSWRPKSALASGSVET